MAPPRPNRRHGGAIALALLATACSGDVTPPLTVVEADGSVAAMDGVRALADDVQPPQREGLQDALDGLAAGFAAGDADAVAAWLFNPSSTFGKRWQDRARWLAAVPLAHYALVADPSLGDLASDDVRERLPGAQVVYVVEELALDGFDDPDRPAKYDLFLTMIDTADGWRVAGDVDAEPLGLVSTDHLWDLGPVEVTRRGQLGALHRPGMRQVAEVLADLEAALATTAQRWPRPIEQAVAVIIPQSQAELGELLHVTFDLSNFVAFATSTAFGELGTYELTGSRIAINPDRFLRHTPATRASILVHELTHVATHPDAGPFVPSWLNEGVAQAIGEQRSATGTALLDQHVAGGWDHRPPTDAQFVVGGRDRVFLSYQLGWSLVDHLVDVHGAELVAQFYAASGRGAAGRAGTEAWHLDRAAREVFGVGFHDLTESWAASLAG